MSYLSHSEFYFWYLIPTLIGVFNSIKSFQLTKAKPNISNVFLMTVILALTTLAQVILIQIFFLEYYPTYIPHAATAIATLLVIVQYLL